MEMTARSHWTSAHWTLLFIIITPMLVVALATFIFKTGWGLPDGTRNQGVLLEQPVDLSDVLPITKQDVFFSKQSVNPWRFAVVLPEVCDRSCEERLWFIKQVRIALGKYQNRIENVALVPKTFAASYALEKKQPITAFELPVEKQQQLAASHKLTADDVMFYVVDPQGLAMMVYSQQHSYQQVIKDMKFLFKGVE